MPFNCFQEDYKLQKLEHVSNHEKKSTIYQLPTKYQLLKKIENQNDNKSVLFFYFLNLNFDLEREVFS